MKYVCWIILGVFGLGLLLPGSVSAVEEKVGIVDIQKVLDSVSEGKRAKADLEKAFKKKKDELENKRKAYEKLDAQFFNAEEKAYLRPTLEALTTRYMDADNVDIVSELVECMHFLTFYDSPVYAQAIQYIFEKQKPDGHWAIRELAAVRNKEFVNAGFYLHTTLVALRALTTEFENP